MHGQNSEWKAGCGRQVEMDMAKFMIDGLQVRIMRLQNDLDLMRSFRKKTAGISEVDN